MGNQLQLPLLARLDGPAVVNRDIVRQAHTYREACRLAWQLRRARHLSQRQLACEIDVPYQHVSDYLNRDDKPGRRDLPGRAVHAFESVVGNTLLSQWHAMQAELTVLEELQVMGRAA